MRKNYSPAPRVECEEQFPEKRLVMALIWDAVHCVRRNAGERGGPRRLEFLQARAWLLDKRRDWPFAFENLCDVVGLEADAVRKSLRLESVAPRRLAGAPSAPPPGKSTATA